MSSDPVPTPVAVHRVARIVHAALLGGSFVATAVLALARGGFVSVSAGDAAAALRYVSIGVLLVDVVAAQVFRGRIAPLSTGGDEPAWWTANLAKALIVWGLLESAVLFGAVIHFATDDWVPLAVASAGLYLLWGARPARLLGG